MNNNYTSVSDSMAKAVGLESQSIDIYGLWTEWVSGWKLQ